MQLGPVICIRLAYLSYKKNGTSQEATTPADPSIKRIKNRFTVKRHHNRARMECASTHSRNHRTTTPTTAAYETGQQPSIVPLPFGSILDCIQHYHASDPPRWQLIAWLCCTFWTCLLAHSPWRIDSAWHLAQNCEGKSANRVYFS